MLALQMQINEWFKSCGVWRLKQIWAAIIQLKNGRKKLVINRLNHFIVITHICVWVHLPQIIPFTCKSTGRSKYFWSNAFPAIENNLIFSFSSSSLLLYLILLLLFFPLLWFLIICPLYSFFPFFSCPPPPYTSSHHLASF